MTQDLHAALSNLVDISSNADAKGAIAEENPQEAVLVLTREAALSIAKGLIEDVIAFDKQGSRISSDSVSRHLLLLPGSKCPWICSSEIVANTVALKARLVDFYRNDEEVVGAIHADPTMPWNRSIS